MFRFAIKNMLIKKVQVILVLLSIVISAGVGVLAFNTAEQVSDGITNTAAYYSAIIGPAGSKTHEHHVFYRFSARDHSLHRC